MLGGLCEILGAEATLCMSFQCTDGTTLFRFWALVQLSLSVQVWIQPDVHVSGWWHGSM